MYSINGVALDNNSLGWSVQVGSQPFPDVRSTLAAVGVPGRDGVLTDPAATLDATVRTLVVRTPVSNMDALVSLVRVGGTITRTGEASRSAAFEFVSASPRTYWAAVPYADVTIALRVSGAFWRATSPSTFTASLATGTATLDVFTSDGGLSAPVQDVVVRVRGYLDSVLVTDSGGSWFNYPEEVFAAPEFFRFEAETGRAFVTSSDTWTGGTEVSGQVDFGGPRGVFEVTPQIIGGNPNARRGRLTVEVLVPDANAQVEVRGYDARLI